MRKSWIDYVYHLYTAELNEHPDVTLSDEHLDHGWFSPEEVRSLNLMEGALEVFEFFVSQ